MKLILTKRGKWLTGGAAVLLTATPSFALFGIGDIVFDPTSYASLVQQLPTLHALENVNVANMFGETAGMSIALNTDSPSASSTAWKAATVTMNGSAPTYLASQSLGSARTSQLALIETFDAVSPDWLTAVGHYRGDRSTNGTANSSLLSSQFDVSDSTNSEVQQLNLLNAAEAQKMAEMQSQGTLQACLASQMTLANLVSTSI